MRDYKIVSRPGPLYWGLVTLPTLFALAPLIRALLHPDLTPDAGEVTFSCIAALVAVAAWVLTAVYVAQNVVIADANGLRWRQWRGWHPDPTWHSCSWPEVSDFYVSGMAFEPSVSPEHRSMSPGDIQIETRDRRRATIGTLWTETTRIAEFIVEKATGAEAARGVDGKPALLAHGTRPADLPLTLAYDATTLGRQRREIILSYIRLSTFFALAMGGAYLGLSYAPRPHTGNLVQHVVAPVLGGLLVLIVTAFTLQARSEVKQIDEAIGWSAEGRKVVATREGMTLWQGGESSFAAWDTVIGWEFPLVGRSQGSFVSLGSARIALEHGREVVLSALVSHYSLVQPLLKTYATGGVQYRLGNNQVNALGGVSRRWSGGEEGKGARVFRALTKTNVAGFGVLNLLPAIMTFALIRLWTQLHTFDGLEPIIALIVVGSSLSLVYLAWVLTGRIEVDNKGLSRVGLRGQQTVLWDEIARYNVEYSIYLETADGRKVEFSPVSYAYGSELPALVTENVERIRRARER